MPAGIRDSDRELAFLIASDHHESSTQQSLFLHTACPQRTVVKTFRQKLCSEKNYRLQDIQLSKNPRYTASRFRELARRAASLAKLLSVLEVRLPPSRDALRWRSRSGLPSKARVSERGMVENTGLEPVTSWLQTRRSPS